MKIDRLLGIVMALLREGKSTAPQLARRFEVSRRTISRDVEALCRAGVPLVTEQGSGGGISIAEGYRVDAALLTREELESILAGVRGIDSISEAPSGAALRDKLRSSGRFAVRDELLIDLSSHYREAHTKKIACLREAIRDCRLVWFTYYAQRGETVRRVEPYFVLYEWSDWYLYGYCRLREDFRLFKLTRLWDLHGTEETFSPRPVQAEQINPQGFFTDAIEFEGLFALEARYRLIEAYGPQCFKTQPDGRLLMRVGYTSRAALTEWAMSFGDALQVCAPDWLRAEIVRQARRICERAGDTQG